MISFRPIENHQIAITVSMMVDFYAIDNYPIEVETSKKLLGEFISNKNLGKSWLIYNAEEVAGYVILTFGFSFEYGGKIGILDELYVSENARGNGIGKAALNFIQEEVAKLSLKLLYLEVEPHNANAQKLYIASDFSNHHRKLLKYKPN